MEFSLTLWLLLLLLLSSAVLGFSFTNSAVLSECLEPAPVLVKSDDKGTWLSEEEEEEEGEEEEEEEGEEVRAPLAEATALAAACVGGEPALMTCLSVEVGGVALGGVFSGEDEMSSSPSDEAFKL